MDVAREWPAVAPIVLARIAGATTAPEGYPLLARHAEHMRPLLRLQRPGLLHGVRGGMSAAMSALEVGWKTASPVRGAVGSTLKLLLVAVTRYPRGSISLFAKGSDNRGELMDVRGSFTLWPAGNVPGWSRAPATASPAAAPAAPWALLSFAPSAAAALGGTRLCRASSAEGAGDGHICTGPDAPVPAGPCLMLMPTPVPGAAVAAALKGDTAATDAWRRCACKRLPDKGGVGVAPDELQSTITVEEGLITGSDDPAAESAADAIADAMATGTDGEVGAAVVAGELDA